MLLINNDKLLFHSVVHFFPTHCTDVHTKINEYLSVKSFNILYLFICPKFNI